MSLKQNDNWNENKIETEEEKYSGKKLCEKCGNYYHPVQFEMCYSCFSKQPSNGGYESVKDATESTDPEFFKS